MRRTAPANDRTVSHPALLLAPDEFFHGATFDSLASQIDLVPSLLSIAGIDYRLLSAAAVILAKLIRTREAVAFVGAGMSTNHALDPGLSIIPNGL